MEDKGKRNDKLRGGISAGDVADFESLFLRLKEEPVSPVYQNFSFEMKDYLGSFAKGQRISRKIKKAACGDFNRLLGDRGLYGKLVGYYGADKLAQKLSSRTVEYLDDTRDLNAGPDDPESAAAIVELNRRLVKDIYREYFYNVKTLAKEIIFAIALAVFLRTFFFQIYKIPTTSMVDTLMPGDQIFVSKVTYGPKIPFTPWRIPGVRKPWRAEVIVFVPPHDRGKVYIKRLIGLPGDKVYIKEGNVFVNGKMAVEPAIARNYYYNQGQYAQDGQEIAVPEGKYFFLGDNSMSSQDSRYWGFADEKDIVGKAIFIWWPFNRAKMIE